MVDDPMLAGTTHVIVDEVHERSLDSDFLLTLLRVRASPAEVPRGAPPWSAPVERPCGVP
jgi:hypothetical protein